MGKTASRLPAAAAAVVVAFGLCNPLLAADSPVKPGSPDAAPLENRTSFFAGGDTARDSFFAWVGMIGAPQGLDESGPRLRVTGGAGRYRYRSGAVAGGVNEGTVASGEVLYGFHRRLGEASLTLYAGGHVENQRLRLPDPGHRTQGTEAGVKAALDFFRRLGPDLFVTGSLSASTVHRAYHARAALTREQDAELAYGVEAAVNGNRRYVEPRAGLFAQSRRGRATAALSAGYLWNSDRGTGPYATLSLHAPY